MPFEEPKEKVSEEIEVVDEEVIEDKIPIDIPTIKNSSTLEVPNKEDKKKELLRKAIQKKKENSDDDHQQKLF